MSLAKEDLKMLVELLVKHLVDGEDAVMVKETAVGSINLFEIHVASADFGKLIGQSGAHANAIRLLLRSMGKKYRTNAYIDIIDGTSGQHFDGFPADPPSRNDLARPASRPGNAQKKP